MRICECWDAVDIGSIRAAVKTCEGDLRDVFVDDGNSIDHLRFECTTDTLVKLTLLHVDGFFLLKINKLNHSFITLIILTLSKGPIILSFFPL